MCNNIDSCLDVRDADDPCPELPGEAQGVEDDEGRVAEPAQERRALARDAQGVERVSAVSMEMRTR